MTRSPSHQLIRSTASVEGPRALTLTARRSRLSPSSSKSRFGQGRRVVRRPRYPSDLTDAQWALLEPLLPPPSKDGRKPKHPRRDLVDAILYVGRTGCAWRALPVDFPPWQTVELFENLCGP